MYQIRDSEFPLCCKARILSGFPQGDRVMYIDDADEEDIRRSVQKFMDRYWKNGYAMLIATLREEQTTTARVLKELGWRSTGWMDKRNQEKHLYKMSKISLWYCQFDEFEWSEGTD